MGLPTSPAWALLPTAAGGGATVPVYRARLPRAEKLLPYLQRIDEHRWYTNRGALACELEQRLAGLFASDLACVGVTHTGTAALEAAVLATAGPAKADRPLALLPAYTFAATALALERCGYRPHLVDVEERSWSMDAEALLRHPLLHRAGVVIPVSPYGTAPRQAAWRAFRDLTGIQVVIDAAAALEAVAADPEGTAGEVPVALSFQATKPFSTGEGGAVVWKDEEGLRRVARAVNFGFLHSRETQSPGTNGRMSEYHAAVGLAALDEWPATQAARQAVCTLFRRTAAAHGIADRIMVAPAVASCYALVLAPDASRAQGLTEELNSRGIEHRFWYGHGLHAHRHFAAASADPLPVTERLAPCMIGVPIFDDLPEEVIGTIIACSVRELA